MLCTPADNPWKEAGDNLWRRRRNRETIKGGRILLVIIQSCSLLIKPCVKQPGMRLKKVMALSTLCAAGVSLIASINADEPTLARIQQFLSAKRMVDLTNAFEPGIPHWPGFPDEKRETIYWYEKGKGIMGDGFFTERYTHVGQWGTYVDPPAHFHKGLRTVDHIELKEMILPLVVVDVHAEVEKDPDYTLTL